MPDVVLQKTSLPEPSQPPAPYFLPPGEVFEKIETIICNDGRKIELIIANGPKTYIPVTEKMPETFEEKVSVVFKELAVAREIATVVENGFYTSYAEMTEVEFMTIGEMHAPKDALGGNVSYTWDNCKKPINGWQVIKIISNTQNNEDVVQITQRYRWPKVKQHPPHQGNLIGNIEEEIIKKNSLSLNSDRRRINIHVKIKQ